MGQATRLREKRCLKKQPGGWNIWGLGLPSLAHLLMSEPSGTRTFATLAWPNLSPIENNSEILNCAKTRDGHGFFIILVSLLRLVSSRFAFLPVTHYSLPITIELWI